MAEASLNEPSDRRARVSAIAVRSGAGIRGRSCSRWEWSGRQTPRAAICFRRNAPWALASLSSWLALLLLVASAIRAQQVFPSEYQVKAVWLLNFARFVEWPESAFTNAQAPLVVGLLGKDPFGMDLEKTFAGKTIKGREFEIRRVSSENELRRCQILFVAFSERKRLRDLMEKPRAVPILTVGETDDFLDQGGVINFLLRDNSVRFEINLKAAQAAQLKLDANLLKVAVTVRGKYD
jgi:hypothetical protein